MLSIDTMKTDEGNTTTATNIWNTTNAHNETTGETDTEMWSKTVMFWSLSFIIPIGLLFNGISVPVFMSKPLRVRSASWYLAALAIADSVTLITCGFEYWMKDPHIGIPVIKTSLCICILVTYLSYASRLFSAILVMSFTVERFICVVAPLQRAELSKPGRVRKLISLQCVLCILCTSFIPFTMEIKEGAFGREAECDVRKDRYGVYIICTAIFLLFGSIVIPIILIFTLNAFIMNKLFLRRSSLAHQNSSSRVGFARQVRRKSFNTVTILLAVSSSFVILNIPYSIAFSILYFQRFGIMQRWGSVVFGSLYAAKYLTSVPYYFNYCVNFLLYNVCARAFRTEIRRLICYTCRVYHEKKMIRKRNSTLSRTTQSTRLTTETRSSRKICNQFCGNGYCIRPETSSFASEPVNMFHGYVPQAVSKE